ncbi:MULTISPECIES: AraC family transcriptional regulator [unclassified Marichromatium]|uniref:AraC family transcriptional regulator n=1 Tax=unclassified Marichromatium TaxID=2618417 RepID=UPI000F3B8B23|nr:AraC family transcriptional regulator [Marichromatium sp. AB31]MBO8085161.1 AraC family transcriptional regulator [Marichromatium sp.]RNE88833.1 AraC family transcriptional regulator [Marichromatium sp. AB31]
MPPGLQQPLARLRAAHQARARSGTFDTEIPGVRVFWTDASAARTPMIYEPGIVIIAGGHKTVYLGRTRFGYDPNHYLIVSVPLPLECETHASPSDPLLGLFVAIDWTLLHELVALVCGGLAPQRPQTAGLPRGLAPVALDAEMIATTARLLHALDSPLESQVLGRALVRELHYRALLGPHGPALCALTQHQDADARIARALARIHRDYAKALSVESLATEAHMGASTFHRAFKQVTGETPLRYLKRIRLDRARALIAAQGVRASVAATRVGYQSASQFSREFKRHFRVSPAEVRHATASVAGPVPDDSRP